jgi:hypothetical protein
VKGVEVTAGGERFRIVTRKSGGDTSTHDITWLSAPGGATRGVSITGVGLTCECLVREALAYASTEREHSTLDTK